MLQKESDRRLITDFLGYNLRSPLALSEGPLSSDIQFINTAAEQDVGLIFTKSIRLESIQNSTPFLLKVNNGLINSDWSCTGLQHWLSVFSSIQTSVPIVASIAKNYVTSDIAVWMAKKLIDSGAKIISFSDYNPTELSLTIRLARKSLDVPLLVKLPPFIPNIQETLDDLVDAGIDGIVAMDSIGPGLTIDIEKGVSKLGGENEAGYISNASMLPLCLKYIYDISQYVTVPVVGVGGGH